MEQSLNLGVIGNCSVAALISQNASIEWFCYPQYDSDPVFSRLINGPVSAGNEGYFSIEIESLQDSVQKYLSETAIIETIQTNDTGDEIKIIDFCPVIDGNDFNDGIPKAIIRIIYPVKGISKVNLELKPTLEYGAEKPSAEKAVGHTRYYNENTELFLQTNLPNETDFNEYKFSCDEPVYFVLGENFQVKSLSDAEALLEKTSTYWTEWLETLNLPSSYIDEVVRAAIALKICTHKPTGGAVAALTCSIPEYDECKYRHWDYRYSWVRDNYFTVNALYSLGDYECLNIYSEWLKDVLAFCRKEKKYPAAFRISGTHDAEESICETLSGYKGQGTVRVGNEAYEQEQNDFFAAAILTVKPYFTDTNLKAGDCPVPVEWLEDLARTASERYGVADAGLWEFRTRAEVYTYSAVNCWSACHSMYDIFKAIGNEDKALEWEAIAKKIYDNIYENAWNADLESYTNAFNGTHADASMFLLSELGFLKQGDERLKKTNDFLEKRLRKGPYVFRHDHKDDFGTCIIAFVSCTFWMLSAFIDQGDRIDDAKEIFEEFLSSTDNAHGLLSEHIDQETGQLWANYPQTYSMAGIVSVASKLKN